jgi:hypothetical protein
VFEPWGGFGLVKEGKGREMVGGDVLIDANLCSFSAQEGSDGTWVEEF